ncbi:hypothetical protein D1AOALGA4SA_8167 [Olavius algarvensis Delta 1 endosymbiont]|nr:hypothetical protein D1AOALGA4SA_8167 [Olavius algarvensis Delta 1 endosymbiont]
MKNDCEPLYVRKLHEKGIEGFRDLGIEGFRNLGNERILSILNY